MHQKFTKPYDPTSVEQNIYQKWEKSGYFNPDKLKNTVGETFTVVLPPPNVTGVLHLGHAYEDSLQDAVIRYQRMKGKKTLWIPGTDSAAIATQARVEKNILKDEGKSRHDLGRDELVKRVSEFAKNSESTILNQVKRMGSSLDWSRYAYTLDEKRNFAVSTAFVNMYKAGLIYRGNRIVNWDPKGQTTISDDEIEYEERIAKFYTFKYSAGFPISISTTRPETKVGDTAVAVHPEDERYKKFIGKEYDLIFCDVPLKIKIIADQSIDKDFGTGAIGVTPAHSQIDWEIADRHNLQRPQVINEYAKMTVEGFLKNQKTTIARESVVNWLKENNLLEKEEDIKQNISISSRTGAIIEPLPKLQWWIDVNKKFKIEKSEIPSIKDGDLISLKEIMRIAVENNFIEMPQERFRKTYFHWIENLRDWCISRQIWFGHRIPVWYKGEEIYCDTTPPTDSGWTQEEDVLDTWFSSALWTFSTLGWPEKTADFEKFHPTNFMCPAYEILQLWVSRMILMSGFHLGQIPFKKVLIHGLVRDKSGRKFSKSLGNGIDPIEMIEKYGADALRMGLLAGTAIGNDIKFDESKVKGYKHFANKIWNITRFILENIDKEKISEENFNNFTKDDLKLLKDFDDVIVEVTKDFDNYNIHLAIEKIYHYIWHQLADNIIEDSKAIFKNADENSKVSRQNTLFKILKNSLKILHPLMPFVTEEIWSEISLKESDMLIICDWPKTN
ncbi:MAG TPA: valine--tRNA ligase [Candidatus Paceibacterota bacterium]|nr:valine--tRNA ligase [Candidatus Paceibacterota bacterium]HMP19108.1 valine--tRNA ligase [Candidatus Paceibacterota bacterium]HMP85112.1 valine--tRNA ligase [Candidatus Paceibacterota bacterium]